MPKKTNTAAKPSPLIDFFSSTRLAIYLLIGLTLACVAGMLIPQKGVTLQPQDYENLIRFPFWRALDTLGFLNVFSSVWFLALTGLLLVNLYFCSVKSYSRTKKRIAQGRRPVSKTLALAQGFHRIWNKKAMDAAAAEEALGKLGTVHKQTGEDGQVHLRVEKGALTLFMPLFLHASIVLMIVGGVIDVLAGFDGQMNIVEGSKSKIFSQFGTSGETKRFELPFEVKCDDFELQYYPGTRRPKDYISVLTVIDGGQEVLTKRIEVNDPMEYKGFRFFQSSYGTTGNSLHLEITRKADGKTVHHTVDAMETSKVPEFAEALPGDGGAPGLIGLAVVDMREDFQSNGPAIKLSILRTDSQPEPFWLFLSNPKFDEVRNGPYTFVFKGVKDTFYTGLMVVRKPGAIWIWIGSAIFMVGLFWNFFLPYRRAWITIGPEGTCIAGAADKSKDAWYKSLAEAMEPATTKLGRPSDSSEV